MSEQPSRSGEITPEELAAAARRATAAGIPVADVQLHGAGSPFEPSRGATGARYRPEEISVRELTLKGSGALDAGIALYPSPNAGVHRVIVVPLADRNWLPHTEARETTVAQAAAGTAID